MLARDMLILYGVLRFVGRELGTYFAHRIFHSLGTNNGGLFSSDLRPPRGLASDDDSFFC